MVGSTVVWICLRNRRNSWCRCRGWHWAMILPAAMLRVANKVAVPCRS